MYYGPTFKEKKSNVHNSIANVSFHKTVDSIVHTRLSQYKQNFNFFKSKTTFFFSIFSWGPVSLTIIQAVSVVHMNRIMQQYIWLLEGFSIQRGRSNMTSEEDMFLLECLYGCQTFWIFFLLSKKFTNPQPVINEHSTIYICEWFIYYKCSLYYMYI